MVSFIVILLSCTVFALGQKYIPQKHMYIYGFLAGATVGFLGDIIK